MNALNSVTQKSHDIPSGFESLFNSKYSVSGKIWQFRPCDDRQALVITQRHGLSATVGQLLSSRGIFLENVESFLEPTLRNLMPNPSHLKDMDCAIDRVIQALKNNEKIAVFGDYDVDGGTSCALLHRYFSLLGQSMLIYIPDLMDEGYGPINDVMHTLKNEGYPVVLMVGCGTTAF